MELPVPRRLGGRRYLVEVSVGRDPDDDTVRDCPVCGGYCYDDDWHLVAAVAETGGPDARFHFCSPDCLDGWLGLFPDH